MSDAERTAAAQAFCEKQARELDRRMAAEDAGVGETHKVSRSTPLTGPPPAGPLMCFMCLTGACNHEDHLSPAHGGGLVPAITTFSGTALCLDCAMIPAHQARGVVYGERG
jgi:hypothetical protein